MAKFHINKHGVPAPCKAKPGNCPLGGNESHFNSAEEAQRSIDTQNEKEFGLLCNTTAEISNEDRLENILNNIGEEKAFEELYFSMPSNKVKEIKNAIIKDYDLYDHIDRDYRTHAQFDQIKRFLGAKTAFNEISAHLSAKELKRSLNQIEEDFSLKHETKVDDIEQQFTKLISDTQKYVKELNEDVESWLDETEDLV